MEKARHDNLLNYIRNGEYPEGYSKSQKFVLRRASKSFTIENGKLKYKDVEKDGGVILRLVIVGDKEVQRVYDECHSNAGGHLGRDATLSKIKSRYYWPNYYKDIEEKIKTCDRCQRNASQLKSAAAELQPVAVKSEVWYLVGMDLIGPFKRSPEGYQYVLTMTDYFSKYVEVVPILDKSAIAVAIAIYQVYCTHGAPVAIIADQGREFNNKINATLQKKFGVKMRITSPYHPQSNGLDERTNQTLKRSLSKLMIDHHDDWAKYLHAAVFAINTSTQASTKISPFKMMFGGREPRFPLEAEKQGENIDICSKLSDLDELNPKDILDNAIMEQQSLFKVAEENISKAQKKQIEQYRMKNKLSIQRFTKGSKVLRRNMKQKTKKGHKSEDRWLGPYMISDITNTTCQLVNMSGHTLKTRVNLNQLKLYHETSETCELKPCEMPLSTPKKESVTDAIEEPVIIMQHTKEEQFGGIQNRHNSCWLISLIQLVNATDLNQFFYGSSTLNDIQQEFHVISNSLSQCQYVDITIIKSMLGKPLSGNQQQDAIEGLECLLDNLTMNLPTNKCNKLFCFSYLSKAYCSHCHNSGTMEFEVVSTEEHPILYCSLGNSRQSISADKLVSSNYDIDYVVPGPKDRICMKCKKRGFVNVTSALKALPKNLIVTCKRNIISGRSNRAVVLKRIISFKQENGDEVTYDLKAFIVHHGSTTLSGHYTTYVIHEDVVVHCNDSEVTRVSTEMIDSSYNERNVVILLYTTSQIPVHVLDIDTSMQKVPESKQFCAQFPDEVAETAASDQLMSIHRLTNNEWLDDRIIDEYFGLLSKISGNLKVLAASSFFATTLRKRGYKAATKYIHKSNIFNHHIILIPWNVGNYHWILLVVKPREKIVMYLDSGPNLSRHEVENSLWCFLCEAGLEMGIAVVQSEWKRWDSKMCSMPLQSNGIDCGVFVCMAARFIVHNETCSFTQADMPEFRRMIKTELTRNQLIPLKFMNPLRSVTERGDGFIEPVEVGSGSESADDDPVSVPNDVTLPTNFILPNFTTVKSNEESIDIFNFDHRSIEEIWIDYSKAYFTEHTQPSSDCACMLKRQFIRQVIKSNEEKWRSIVKGTLPTTYSVNVTKAMKYKLSTQWPIELDDMAFEVETYLKAIQCDVLQLRSINNLHIARFILWPEAMILLIARHCDINLKKAKKIYDEWDTETLRNYSSISNEL